MKAVVLTGGKGDSSAAISKNVTLLSPVFVARVCRVEPGAGCVVEEDDVLDRGARTNPGTRLPRGTTRF